MRDLDLRPAAGCRGALAAGLVTAAGEAHSAWRPRGWPRPRRGELPPARFADHGRWRRCAAVGELGLPACARRRRCRAGLRTLLWHLDRIVDHQPRATRVEAIARVAADFRAEWTVERGWEKVLARCSS
jgi:hypothetical protein